MGNSNTKQEVEDRLARLEGLADVDNDGVVSREELEEALLEKESEIDDLRKAYDEVMAENARLTAELMEEQVKNLGSEIASSSVGDFVEELMKDPKYNAKWVPDKIEKPIQVANFKLMLHAIKNICEAFTYELFGHELKLVIVPKAPETLASRELEEPEEDAEDAEDSDE